MRLWQLLSTINLVLVLVGFMGFGAYMAQQQSHYLLEGLQRDTRNLAQSIAASSADDLLLQNFDRIETELLRQVTLGATLQLAVANAQGLVISSVRRNAAGRAEANYEDIMKPLALEQTETLGENRYSLVVPIKRGQLVGWVAIDTDLSGLDQLRRQIFIDSLGLGLGLLIPIGLLIGLVLRRASHELELASDFAVELVHQRGHRLPAAAGSKIVEITRLNHALNDASAALSIQYQRLRDGEARKSAFLEASLDCLITIDAKGYIVDFNPAAERTFGYQQVEVIGEPMGDLIIPPAYRQAHNQGMGHFNKTGIGPVLNQRIEVEAMRRDGSLFPAELAVIPFTRGGHQYFHGSMRDISERKALEKSRQEVREREMAYGSEIQRSLLFGRLPERIREVSIAVSAESSAGVDGDFYDLFSYRDDLFDIAIGDVMGKGVSAALVGAAVKMQLNRVLAEQWSHLCDGFNYSDQPGPLVCHGQANACSSRQIPSPATLINALHDKIGPRLIELDTFLTLSYLRVDVANRHLLMVDAGHTRAIHTGPDGLRLLSGDNLPLGVLDEECYVQRQVSISDGDLILLYSDGLTEARNDAGEEFGVERLGKLVDQLYQHGVPGPILLQAVRQQVREFEAYAPPGDDRTCIILHFAPTPRECIEPLRLPRDFAVLPTLRRWVGAAAKVVGLRDEAADAMLLAAVETVTNIMRHVPPKLSDAFILCEAEAFERGLQIDFIYLGEPFQPEDIEPDLSGESEGGFGLYIIRNSVDLDQYDCLAEGVNRIRLRKQVTDGDD